MKSDACTQVNNLRHKELVSELGQEKWTVISERGREASGLVYEDARRLVHRLTGEGRHGLCIVTDEAAGRMTAPVLAPDDLDIFDKV
jgi:hypothetical protein